MEVLNSYTVVVNNNDELKESLENDNGYTYIYFGSDIQLSSKILINPNKTNIVIDGTYKGVRYTYRAFYSIDRTDIITSSQSNKHITIKNINVINICRYGIIYVPQEEAYKDLIIECDNMTFNGIEVIFNPYGKAKIINSNIVIETTSGIVSQEVCEANTIEIGGNTTIYSTSNYFSLFYFLSTLSNPSLTFLPNSYVTITSTNKELMVGTQHLNLNILRNAVVNIISKNGLSPNYTDGIKNLLIDKYGTLNFTETNHINVPMLIIYGTLTMNEKSSLILVNAYESAPVDNYSIYFKGENNNIILNNPKKVVIYNKMSNIFYTDNLVNFTFNISRINMWNNSYDLTVSGTINNIPDYSWYKDNDLLLIEGTFTSNALTITNHNLTNEELTSLPDLSNFTFHDKKQMSIGTEIFNIHPINSNSNQISGHTNPNNDVLIKYNDNSFIVSSDENGLFSLNITWQIKDQDTIEITTNESGSYIYTSKKIIVPFTGELTIIKYTSNIIFSLTLIEDNLLIKKEEMSIRVVDSREETASFKLYIKKLNDLTSLNNYVLTNALVFKKLDNEVFTLTDDFILIYEEAKTNDIYDSTITFSKEKGLLLDLSDNALEVNEEYFAEIMFDAS